MNHQSIFHALVFNHRVELHCVVGVLALVAGWAWRAVASTRKTECIGLSLLFAFAVPATFSLQKWLIALGAVSSGFRPTQNWVAYADHYFSSAGSYLTSWEVALPALCFYGFISAVGYCCATYLREFVENNFVRKLCYAILLLLASIFALGVPVPFVIGFLLLQARKPRVTFEFLSGTEVIDDNSSKALSRVKQALGRTTKDCIRIHSNLRVPRNFENQHFMIVGRTGSGKTNALAPMVDDIVKRGDKVILYDVKRDFTAAYKHDKRTILLSPFDARSKAWNIAKDIRNEIDADELAKALFPSEQGREPFFALAGQNITKSAMLKLQAEKGEHWGFKDLAELFSNKQYIMDAVKQYVPASSQVWGGDSSKQNDGVFGEIRTRLSCFDYFAKAWPNSHLDGVSLSEWLKDSNAPNLILIQGNDTYSFVDTFFTSLIYTHLFKQMQSFDDNQSRRVWAVIEELSSLPELPNLGSTLRKGRSKGLCLVLVLQDFGGLDKKYAEQGGREALVNNIATKVIGALSAPESAEYASKIAGQNEYLQHTFIPFSKKNEMQPHPVPVSRPAVSSTTFRTLKLPTLHRPAQLYLLLQGAPIVKIPYRIQPMPKISEPFVAAKWMDERAEPVQLNVESPKKKTGPSADDLKRQLGEMNTLTKSFDARMDR